MSTTRTFWSGTKWRLTIQTIFHSFGGKRKEIGLLSFPFVCVIFANIRFFIVCEIGDAALLAFAIRLSGTGFQSLVLGLSVWGPLGGGRRGLPTLGRLMLPSFVNLDLVYLNLH